VADRFKEGNEYLAVSTGLATGAVAFAIGLLAAPIVLPMNLRWALVGAIILLAGAIVCILLAKGAIVWRVAANSGSIDDIQVLAIVMIALLALGCIVVAVVLVLTMLLVPDVEAYRTRSAQDAIRVAMVQIAKKPCHRIDRLPTVELIKGLDSATARDATWHVHADLRQPLKHIRGATACPAAYDVFVDARDSVGILY